MTTHEPTAEALAAANKWLDGPRVSIGQAAHDLALAFDAFRLSTVGVELAQMILADCTDTTPQAWIDAASALVDELNSLETYRFLVAEGPNGQIITPNSLILPAELRDRLIVKMGTK